MMLEAYEIYRYLRTNLLIQWTWGFNNPKTIAFGLEFDVKGLAFSGTIRIRKNREDGLCVLYFINEQGRQIRKIWDVKLKNLIPLLDANIDGVEGEKWQAIKKTYLFK